ncbi:hypothetical protein F4782DRAFT_511026 [Xylaria castorea]|nr:hypothetical protein F4782DRAFT_511026 [Xylaria castorea]
MHRCSNALVSVKFLNTNVRFSKMEGNLPGPSESPQLIKEVETLFADVSGNTTNMETLEWDTPSTYAHYFEQHFVDRGLVMPSVKQLEPGPMSHFLVRFCLNGAELRSRDRSLTWKLYGDDASVGDTMLLIQACAFASNSPKLSIGWDYVTASNMQDIMIAMPSLRGLELKTGLSPRYNPWNPFEPGDHKPILGQVLKPLSGLVNLTHLGLPGPEDLDVTSNLWPPLPGVPTSSSAVSICWRMLPSMLE